MPGMPRFCGCESGNAPRAIRVVTTGAPVSRASSMQLGRRLGLDDAAADVEHRALRRRRSAGRPPGSACRAASSSAGSRAAASRRARRTWSAPAGRPSAGRRAPGPGRPVEAMWNASVIARGMSAGSVTSMLCLVIGSVMPQMSASWNASVPISLRPTCPVIATIGHRVQHRVRQRRDEVRRARARRRDADADPPGGLRVPGGGVPRALLVAHEDVAHERGVVERVVGREDRAAGDAEDDVAARRPRASGRGTGRPWPAWGRRGPDGVRPDAARVARPRPAARSALRIAERDAVWLWSSVISLWWEPRWEAVDGTARAMPAVGPRTRLWRTQKSPRRREAERAGASAIGQRARGSSGADAPGEYENSLHAITVARRRDGPSPGSRPAPGAHRSSRTAHPVSRSCDARSGTTASVGRTA